MVWNTISIVDALTSRVESMLTTYLSSTLNEDNTSLERSGESISPIAKRMIVEKDSSTDFEP